MPKSKKRIHSTNRINLIDPIQIDEGTRFRQEYGDIDGLAASIKKHGIISSLTVLDKRLLGNQHEIEQDELDSDKPFLLLAGGRRLRAARKADIDFVPCTILDHIASELELRQIELLENIQRLDLSWSEKDELTAQIHELQQEIHGKKAHSTDEEGHSQRDTAKLLGKAHTTVQRSLKMAEEIRNNPELAKMPTRKDAERYLKDQEEKILRAELAKRAASRTQTQEEKLKAQLIKRFVLKDAVEGIKMLDDQTFDFVSFDPPYAVDLVEAKVGKTGLDDYNEITEEVYEEWMLEMLGELHRVMKNESWGVLWFAPEPWFEFMFRWLIHSGFKTHRMPLIWTKGQGQTRAASYNLGNSYEMAYYFRKGSPKLNKPGRSNEFAARPIHPSKKIHPTEKPLDLLVPIMETFTRPGQRVLIPCLGSGNDLLAAANLSLDAMGFDLPPDENGPNGKTFKDAFTIRAYEGTYGKYTDPRGN